MLLCKWNTITKTGGIKTIGRTGKQTENIKSNRSSLQPANITPTIDI